MASSSGKIKVVVVGAGFTGVQLARTLIAEGDDVFLVENDPEKVQNARNILDCEVVEGDGNHPDTLERAGIASADALVVLTEDDELNMITCSLVDTAYPDVLKIARVRNYAYYQRNETLSRRLSSARPGVVRRPPFGIDRMLNPDVEAAEAVCRAVSSGIVGNVVGISGGYGILSLSVQPGSPLDGVPLRTLPSVPGWKQLVAYAQTDRGALLPDGNTVLHAGDRIGVLTATDDVPDLLRIAGTPPAPEPRRIVVFGAERIGLLVVERMLSEDRAGFSKRLFGARASRRLILIADADAARCREASERFAEARVLLGDVTEPDFVREESLDESDLLVAASGNPERNLIAAAYLGTRGARRTIAVTASSDFDDVARKLGVDVAVPLRDTVVDAILSHLRGKSVKAVHTVCNRKFEIVECDVSPSAPAAGRPMRDLAEPGKYLLLLLRQPGSDAFTVPRGETVPQPGAHAVLVVRAGDRSVLRLFGGDA